MPAWDLTKPPPQNPNSARLIDWGHSWVAPPPTPYGVTNISGYSIFGIQGNYPWTGEQWPFALRDALGIGSSGAYYKSYYLPPEPTAATNLTTYIDVMPDDATIDSVWWIPNGSITGANSNYRSITIGIGNWFTTSATASSLGTVNFTSGVNATAGVPIKLFSINDGGGLLPGSGIGTPFTPALRGVNGGTTTPQEIVFFSTHTGSGAADPGGYLIIRFGSRYRNYGVAGSQLLSGAIPSGSWVTCLSWSPFSHPDGIEVNFTGAGSIGSGVTVNCSALRYPISSGDIVYFTNAGTTGTLTLSANANFGATSVTGTIAGANVVAGLQGHVKVVLGTNAGAGETLSPTGINVWTHGINDADQTTQDVNAWTETSRAVCAKNLCPVWEQPLDGNFVYSNGSGAWGSISTPTYAGYMLPVNPDPYSTSGAGYGIWTGTAATASDKVTIGIGPLFEGGSIDVMFLALAGSSCGVAASITVDGGNPPQGAVTINTSGVSVSGLLTSSPGGTIAAAGSNTITGTSTSFNQGHLGTVLTGSGGTGSVPAGTVITAVASATSITVVTPSGGTVTVSGATPTCHQYVPMVKRITGLSAGAHTITITITGADSANSSLFLYGVGLESQTPLTPILWCNTPRIPYQTTTQQNNSVALNAASLAMIRGTATPLSGNTAEPAMPSSVLYVDIDSLFGDNNAYFIDGTHLNSRGHRLMARTLFQTIESNFTPDQLISR